MSIIPISNESVNNQATRTSSTNNFVSNNFSNSANFSHVFNNATNNNPVNSPPNVGSTAVGGGTGPGNTITSGNPELDAMFEAAGRQYNINPNLLKAVAQVESNFRADATSVAGAMGIMQIMPSTARHLGVTDPFDPLQSIMGGARYLREQLDRFNGDVSLALAAYNAGWPAVQRHGGIPPFPQTQAYVPRVLDLFGHGDITSGNPIQGGMGVPGANIAHCPTCGTHSAPTPPPNSAPNPPQNPPQNNSSNNINMNEMFAQMAQMMMMNMQMGIGGAGGRNSFF